MRGIPLLCGRILAALYGSSDSLLIALLILVPVIAILGLESSLAAEATGALLGTVVGYALGGIIAAVPRNGQLRTCRLLIGFQTHDHNSGFVDLTECVR